MAGVRTPHSSIIAFLITNCGTVSLCIYVHRMWQNAEEQMEMVGINSFKEPQWLLPMLAIPFMIWMTFLCIIAFFAASITRTDISWKLEKFVNPRMPALNFANVFLPFFTFLTYMTTIFWLLLLAVFGVLVAVNYSPLRPELCSNLVALTECNNYLAYRYNTPFVNLLIDLGGGQIDRFSSSGFEDGDYLCGKELALFCMARVSDWQNSVFAFFSCLFVVLGLIHFLMCMAVNQNTVNRSFSETNLSIKKAPFIEQVRA